MVRGKKISIIMLIMVLSVINIGCSKNYVDDLENSTSTPRATRTVATDTINAKNTKNSTFTPKSNKNNNDNNKKIIMKTVIKMIMIITMKVT